MTSRKVNEELRVSLLNIKRILCEAGDKEICHLLDRIIQSPDKISALLDALSKKMKRGKKRKWESDLMYKKRRKWFLSFVSTKGEKLKAKDAEELARITKDWELSAEQIDALLAYSTLWNSYPGLFWYGGSPDKNVLRSCFNDLERMREVDPIRRRILLITLSNQVQHLQRGLATENRKRVRKRSQNISSKRERVFLPSALRSMTMKLWPNVSPESQKRIKDKITQYSRAGWKWQQLAHTGMLLSFQDSTIKSFERHAWTLPETEAINVFIETLPQYCIQSTLQEAFDSIAAEYEKTTNSLHLQSSTSTGVVQSSALTENQPIEATVELLTSQFLEDSNIPQMSPTTVVDQPPNCTSLPEKHVFGGSSLDDVQAAGILSGIPRNLPVWQSHQGIVLPKQTRDRTSLTHREPLAPVNQKNISPSRSNSRNVTTGEILHGSIQAVAEPEPVLQSLQLPLAPVAEADAEWAQSSADLTQLVSGNEESDFELANPFSSWQPGPFQDLVDWSAALRRITFEDDNTDNSLPDSLSNPFPLCDSMNAFSSIGWSLSTSEDGIDTQ